jgi:hypothetical protein
MANYEGWERLISLENEKDYHKDRIKLDEWEIINLTRQQVEIIGRCPHCQNGHFPHCTTGGKNGKEG